MVVFERSFTCKVPITFFFPYVNLLLEIRLYCWKERNLLVTFYPVPLFFNRLIPIYYVYR